MLNWLLNLYAQTSTRTFTGFSHWIGPCWSTDLNNFTWIVKSKSVFTLSQVFFLEGFHFEIKGDVNKHLMCVYLYSFAYLSNWTVAILEHHFWGYNWANPCKYLLSLALILLISFAGLLGYWHKQTNTILSRGWGGDTNTKSYSNIYMK